MQRFNLSISLAIFFGLIGQLAAQSDTTIAQQIKSNGQIYDINLTAADKTLTTATLWFLSKGNDTQTFNFYLDGPENLSASVKVKALPKKSAAEKLLATDRGFWNIALKTSGSSSARNTLVIKNRSAATQVAAATDPFGGLSNPLGGGGICDLLPKDQIDQLIIFMSTFYGRTVTREEVCSGAVGVGGGGGGTGGGSGGGGSNPFSGYTTGINASGFLLKDACIPDRTSNYLVKVVVDFTKIDKTLLDNGLTVHAGVSTSTYSGSKATSLKPVSDGKFAPRPLILMSTLGGFFGGGERIELYKWSSKGPPKKPAILRVEDYVGYKGLFLARAIATGLTGGKGTFMLTNGSTAYGVCLRLSRTRQSVNGYPN